MRERNDIDCIHPVEIVTDSMLSQQRRLGLYTEAFLTDIPHQTDEVESVMKYVCAATNDQSNVFDGGGNRSSPIHL